MCLVSKDQKKSRTCEHHCRCCLGLLVSNVMCFHLPREIILKNIIFVILIWFCYGFVMVSLWLILCFLCLSSKQLWFRYGFVMVLECFIFSYEICYGWSYLFCKKNIWSLFIFFHISELKKTINYLHLKNKKIWIKSKKCLSC